MHKHKQLLIQHHYNQIPLQTILIYLILQDIQDEKQLVDGFLDQINQFFINDGLDSFVQTDTLKSNEEVFNNVSSAIKNLISTTKIAHQKFNQYIIDNNISQICTQTYIPETTQSSEYNNQAINSDNYIASIERTKNCQTIDLILLFKNITYNLKQKSIIQFLESSGNTITYPYTSNQLTDMNYNQNILNFYGSRIKFIYPCKSFNSVNQAFDFNFQLNNQQKINHNITDKFQYTKLFDFINQLSSYKQKNAACYGDQYISMSDKYWSIGVDNELQDFIGKTYSNESKNIKISQLFNAINKTIASIHHNLQLRIYKQNKPYGAGNDRTSSKMQIFIQDADYIETSDYAQELIKQYTEITKENQILCQFEIVMLRNNNLKKPVSELLQKIFTITLMDLEIDQYIEHQFKVMNSTDSYYIIPSSVDCFNQDVIQICSLINQSSKFNVSVICSSIPIQQIFSSVGQQYIVDTEKEQYIAKNTNNIFHYKYFLAQLEPQKFFHLNQYKKSSVVMNGILHLIENIDGYNRLIIQIREVDDTNYKLTGTVLPAASPFTFDKCITPQTTGFILNTNNKYQVDCSKPSLIFDEIYANPDQNQDAVLLLSDITFNSISFLNSFFGPVGTVIGRMAQNNMSIMLTDMILSDECMKKVRDMIHEYPNEADFTTNKFHLAQLFCFYEQNGYVKSANFSFMIKAHTNLVITDFIFFPSDSVLDLFEFGVYNLITIDYETLFPVTPNHMQTLFQSGLLLCALTDHPDYLHKQMKFGSISKLKSDVFAELDNLNGIVFTMKPQKIVTFNCSEQYFSNEIMKNSQERADYFLNAFQMNAEEGKFKGGIQQVLIIVIGISTGILVILLLRS
ncbi:Conserved_hypothetical protein [Hexamita inflata]|uniref:Uncharacterized protein n=1 Tax=Hexamita inflata TaxID=28002 RepID=A0AA86QB56_9EUKA|nr:Conserved hypothetical protein [Hexamita inflata]